MVLRVDVNKKLMAARSLGEVENTSYKSLGPGKTQLKYPLFFLKATGLLGFKGPKLMEINRPNGWNFQGEI